MTNQLNNKRVDFGITAFELDRNHNEWIFYPDNIEADPIMVCLKKKLTWSAHLKPFNCPHCGDSLINCWDAKKLIANMQSAGELLK